MLILGLLSCTDLKKTAQIDKIDALSQELDSIENVYLENKVDSLQQMSMAVYSVQNRIKNNYVADTIDMELGRKMGKHKWMKKKLKAVISSGKILDGGITQIKGKLNDLKDDIDNGYGEREKYDEYIHYEVEKMNQLKVLYEEYVMLKDSCLSVYTSVHDELHHFSMSLINNK